jgi:nucleolar protein 15
MMSETKKRKRAIDFLDSESDAEDDQTTALVEGLEGSDEEQSSSSSDGLKEGIEVPTIPATKKLQRQLKNAEEKDNDTPGVIYVG